MEELVSQGSCIQVLLLTVLGRVEGVREAVYLAAAIVWEEKEGKEVTKRKEVTKGRDSDFVMSCCLVDSRRIEVRAGKVGKEKASRL